MSQPTSRLALAAAIPIAIIIACSAAATWILCGGHFSYSLDDPYISLALASQISHGHYGLNVGEPASPSSSILYPFLLAPFAWIPGFAFVPLAINALAAAGTAACFAAMLVHYSIVRSTADARRGAFLIVLLCLATGIVAVAFTGLEHSLHAMLCVTIVFGLARSLEGEEPPSWLIGAIAVAPLLRFESLALSCLAIAALASIGHGIRAAAALAVMVASLALYAIAMTALGLPPLPSSVLVKASLFSPGAQAGNQPLDFIFDAIRRAADYGPARLLWLQAAALLIHPILRAANLFRGGTEGRLTQRREALFLTVIAGALAAQVLFGSWGWWFRYEIYALAIAAAGMIVVWQAQLAAFVQEAAWAPMVLGFLLVGWAGLPYIRATLENPFAGRGIYEQQYQMHRFVVDCYPHPVAVNDLGWVSFRNPHYVLDLWGLGSEAARRDRMVTHARDWMDALARAHGVELAMIYQDWFGKDIPPTWVRVATLRSADASESAANREVAFYATSPQGIPDIVAALRRFDRMVGTAASVYLDLDPARLANLERLPASAESSGKRRP